MISREEKIAELLSEFYQEKWYYYKEQNVFMGYNSHKIIEPITLDKDIEEILLCELYEAIDILSFPVKEDNDRNVAINTIRTALSDKNTLINQLLDSEKVLMEDNTKRQEKLNAIEEVVGTSKYEFDTNSWKIYEEIKKILGDKQ